MIFFSGASCTFGKGRKTAKARPGHCPEHLAWPEKQHVGPTKHRNHRTHGPAHISNTSHFNLSDFNHPTSHDMSITFLICVSHSSHLTLICFHHKSHFHIPIVSVSVLVQTDVASIFGKSHWNCCAYVASCGSEWYRMCGRWVRSGLHCRCDPDASTFGFMQFFGVFHICLAIRLGLGPVCKWSTLHVWLNCFLRLLFLLDCFEAEVCTCRLHRQAS